MGGFKTGRKESVQQNGKNWVDDQTKSVREQARDTFLMKKVAAKKKA